MCIRDRSQLSLAAEKTAGRSDHRPQLSDLCDSGSIEQDADIVLFLYRAAYYNSQNGEDSQACLLYTSLGYFGAELANPAAWVAACLFLYPAYRWTCLLYTSPRCHVGLGTP